MSSLADRLKERFRLRLKRWVDRERAAHGCAKTAVKRVASKIGMSVIGVYRAMGDYPTKPVKVQAHHYVAVLIHTLQPRRKHKPALAINITIPEPRSAELIERSQA